jgi:C1A family cysteine protease
MRVLFAVVLSLAVVAQAQLAMPLSAEEEQFEFMSFIKTFNKKYEVAQFFTRFNVFRNELNAVRQHNAGDSTWEAGINEFSDMTHEEFMATRACAMSGDFEYTPSLVDMELLDAANDVDWRGKAVTPVKNQGQCGSCWAFGATGTLEGYNVNVNKKSLAETDFSEQQLVDCAGSQGNQGCNGGMPDRALKYFASAGGACTQKGYPYTGKGGSCKASSCDKVPGTAKGPKNGKGESSLEGLLNTLPVSVAIDASSSFQRYKSGTFTGPCSSTSINHAVLAVGYTADYWIVKNSWGTGWGDKGFIYMKRGQNICNINNYLTVPN